MSGDLDLEQRYRRVLRLLPGYYRQAWEEDMVAAFLDGWLTGDLDEDSVYVEYGRPSRQEIASVVLLAARLYLGGVGAPRRYFPWGQAVRGAVLAVLLLHAVLGLDGLMVLAGTRQLAGYLPPPFSSIWPWVWHAAYCASVLVFVALVLGRQAGRPVGLAAGLPRAVLHPGHPALPGPRAAVQHGRAPGPGPVRPRVREHRPHRRAHHRPDHSNRPAAHRSDQPAPARPDPPAPRQPGRRTGEDRRTARPHPRHSRRRRCPPMSAARSKPPWAGS